MEQKKSIDLAKLSSEEFLKLVEDSTAEELMQLSAQFPPAAVQNPTANMLTRLLAVQEGERGFWDIVRWWEVRRPLYNLLVGLCGLPALAWLMLHLGLFSFGLLWLLPACVYGIAANICYTAGWVSEYAARRCFREKAAHFGAITFTLGTAFSLIMTLLLGVWCVLSSTQLPFGSG